MRDYIILNNKNSNEIKGLLIQNLPPITKPRIRAEIDEIDGRDGDIVTPLGYGAYDKAFSIGLYGDFDINEVIKYFDSEGIVVFSNEPNKYYNYKILEQIDFEKLIRFRTADVMMHVQPFKYSTTEGKETEEMETKTASGSEITLPDTNNEKLQMEKLKGDTHQDTIDAEEGNENEDTNLAVNDVDPSKENYITLKGNTTQYNHDSVNMLPNDMATLSLYGITITKNDDGTYTINGTTTQDFNWAINDTALNLQANTNYFLSGCATGGDAETYCLYISAYADTGNGVLINSSRAINDQVRIFIASGQTFNNAIFKPMLIEGTEAIPFEPYGMTTPSPDYPSEVKVVTGENVLSVQSKNLLPISSNVTQYGITSVKNEDGSISFSGIATSTYCYITNRTLVELPIGNYAFSINKAVNYGVRLQLEFEDGTTSNVLTIATGRTSVGGTTSKIVKAIRIYLISLTSGTEYNDTLYLQLEKGSTTSEYTPYSKTDYTINLGNLELCKIGDYKDYLFKRNGKWYVHKEIEKVVFDGTESWKRTILSNIARFEVENIDYLKGTTINSVPPFFSNYFTSYKYSDIQNGVETGVTWWFNAEKKVVIFGFQDNRSLADFTTWLGTHNTTLYYVLATPTDTQITDTSLIAQLDALHTAQLQETSYINSTPAKEYPYINLKYNVVTPAPSPDRASEINKVTGNNVVSVSGKNLASSVEYFNPKNRFYRVIGATYSVVEGKKYAVSFDTQNTGIVVYNQGASNIKIALTPYSVTCDGTRQTFIGTATETGTFSATSFIARASVDSDIGTGLCSNFMIEEIPSDSSTATPYVPYSKTDYPINLGDIELCKIGDYKDYLFKRNGKWYVHKEIGKVVLNRSANWSKAPATTGFLIGNFPSNRNNNVYEGYSNFFTCVNTSATWQGLGKFGWNTSNTFWLQHTTITEVSQLRDWIEENAPIVYYVLITPTEEEVIDETLLAQLEALDNIYNQKGTTKIKTNPEANNMPLSLDVSYTESRPITITNSGNIYSKPIFTIYGEGNIGVYLNDIQLFNINLGSEEQITIDVAEMQAYNKETKVLKNRLVTGNYDNFVLKVGENKISFSGIVKKFEIENYSRWI